MASLLKQIKQKYFIIYLRIRQTQLVIRMIVSTLKMAMLWYTHFTTSIWGNVPDGIGSGGTQIKLSVFH